MTGYAPCEVSLEFGDGEYLFRLPLKRIAELEEIRGAGIGVIYERVAMGHYHGSDLVETVRLALIGGGMDGTKARKLIDRYCDGWPLDVWLTYARAILHACVVGYESEASEDKEPGEPVTGSTSQPPTSMAH